MTTLPSSPSVHVHVDMDELWAIADCYGLAPFAANLLPAYETGAPRLAALFDEFGIQATWFVVGRDVLNPDGPPSQFLRDRLERGDAVANHSQTHRLDFRGLSREELRNEICEAHEAIHAATGFAPRGFRAPGYGYSAALIEELQAQGYAYDSSLCPSPYGFVFRYLDGQIIRDARRKGWSAPAGDGTTGPFKTQYSILRDLRHPFRPHQPLRSVPSESQGGNIWEYPTATAPGLRLPFQAGIGLRLGRAYMGFQVQCWRALAPTTPMTLLFHGADLADFSVTGHPFFLHSPFFAMPLSQRMDRARYLLEAVLRNRTCILTESVHQA